MPPPPPPSPSPPPPSPTPPPPPPPPPVPVSIVKDPHLSFAHGGKADFKGEHMSWYNLLSARNTSINILFVHAEFHNLNKLVHGSHMAQLAMTVRTMLTGRIFKIEFAATASPPYIVHVRDEAGAIVKSVTHGSGNFVYENLVVSVRGERKHGVFVGSRGAMALISTGRWMVEAASKPFPNAEKNPGKALLDVQLNPLYDADKDVVAPHGLIGQSWDGDNIGIDGAQDNYTAGEVTTKAMAEGAIEGIAADYEMEDKFVTAFKFSRFDAVKAAPRDVSKLSGAKKSGAATTSAGAAPDVDDEALPAALPLVGASTASVTPSR